MGVAQGVGLGSVLPRWHHRRRSNEALIGEARDRQRRRRRRWLAAGVLVAVAVIVLAANWRGVDAASVARNADPAAAVRLPNPCSLLSEAQVEKEFVGHVVTTTAQTGGEFARVPTCTWSGQPLTSHYGQPTASVFLEITRESKTTFLSDQRQSVPPPIAARVPGAVATWSEVSQTLDAWNDGYRVIVSIHGPYATNPFARARALVRDAFARL